jgi:hypothetical protein
VRILHLPPCRSAWHRPSGGQQRLDELVKRLSTILANIVIYGILYAIGIALWLDIIRSGFLSPELVGKIITGAVK